MALPAQAGGGWALSAVCTLMKLRLIAVGARAPSWVASGYAEYSKRLPRELKLELVEVAAPKHHDPQRSREQEGVRTLKHVAATDWVVALDERGSELDSMALADRVTAWRDQGRNVAVVVGGADGLADAVRERANEFLSLSRLTLPHYVVRVVFAEALYRAWSIGAGHPYHRGEP